MMTEEASRVTTRDVDSINTEKEKRTVRVQAPYSGGSLP